MLPTRRSRSASEGAMRTSAPMAGQPAGDAARLGQHVRRGDHAVEAQAFAPRATSSSALRCGPSSATTRNGAPGALVRSPTSRRRSRSSPTTAYRSSASPNGTSARRPRRRPGAREQGRDEDEQHDRGPARPGTGRDRNASTSTTPSTTAIATAASNAGSMLRACRAAARRAGRGRRRGLPAATARRSAPSRPRSGGRSAPAVAAGLRSAAGRRGSTPRPRRWRR